MKKYFELFLRLWNDDRGRALLKLGLYLIFIVFVVAYTRNVYNDTSKPLVPSQSILEKYIKLEKFEETITIENFNYKLSYGDKIIFSDDINNYEVIEDVIYLQGTNDIIPASVYFWNITPNLIGNLVNKKETFYVTNYNDGTKDKAYQISLVDFISKFKGINLEIEFLNQISDETILIVIKETKDNIISVDLDLSSYYKLITGINKEYKIKIEY